MFLSGTLLLPERAGIIAIVSGTIYAPKKVETTRVSEYWSSEYTPASLLPLPEFFTPPKGMLISAPWVGPLILMTPASSALTILSARGISRDHTAAVRPYSVELAAAAASSSVVNEKNRVAGPKNSSEASSWAIPRPSIRAG